MNNKLIKKSVLASLVLIMMTTINSSADSKYIIGNNRYETAVNCSKEAFIHSDNVIVADGYNYQNLINALSLSSKLKAPILYSYQENIDKNTSDEIIRLNPTNIYTVGTKVNNIPINSNVVEINAESYTKNNVEINKDSVNQDIFVVSEKNFADAITVSGYAYQNSIPIVFSSNVKEMDKSFFYNKNIYVVGGNSTIKNEELEDINFTRISGYNRYETNRIFNEKFYGEKDIKILVKGDNYPDSICAGPISDINSSPIILTQNEDQRDFGNNLIAVGGVNLYKNTSIYVNPHQDDETLTMGLDIIRNRHNKAYLLQMTDGSKTQSIHKINRNLRENGLPEITEKEIVESRNKELEECVSKMTDNCKIKYYNYVNLRLTKENVYDSLEEYVKNNDINILKTRLVTMAQLPQYEGSSKGYMDHASCCLGSRDFAKKNHMKIDYWGVGKGFKSEKVYANNEEIGILKKASNSYGVVDIPKGRYGVGFVSVKRIFEELLENGIFYLSKFI